MADPQAEGNPKGTGGITTCGPLLALECQAREPASTLRAGVGEHQDADQEEGLDRSSTQDDETGGAGAWAAGSGVGGTNRPGLVGRDGELWQTTGFGSCGVASELRCGRRSCHRQATLGLPPLG